MFFPYAKLKTEEISGFCGKLTVFENKKNTTNAVVWGSEVELTVTIPKIFAPRSVNLYLYDENCIETRSICVGECIGWQNEYDEYLFSFSSPNPGLYFYKIIIINSVEKIVCYPHFGDVKFAISSEGAPMFQLTVYENVYNDPKSYYGGIIYHIFVDRFNRGGNAKSKAASRVVDDWSGGIPEFPLKNGDYFENNTFFFGTLYGIIDKLDYIASLGVNLIYLSPIFESASNHKYDTADYMKVDEMFGGDEALALLIEKAKERGIGIILDGVFNHTGSDSIYFNKRGNYRSLGAYQSRTSPYFEWYSFKNYPEKYECWWNIDILPRLNLLNEKCRDFFVGDGGVVEKYSKMGISGLRLDVVDELDDDFVADIKFKLNLYNSQSLLFGEVWEDASNKIAYGKRKRYYLGRELDGVMNYPLRRGIIDFLLYRGTDNLKYSLKTVLYNAPKKVVDAQMNILGSHDTLRILTALGDDDTSGLSNADLASYKMGRASRNLAIKRLKVAYTVLCTLPGLPTIYYGDEAGLEGYSDPFNRMPYPWGGEEEDLLSHYKALGEIRRKNDVYKEGLFTLFALDEHFLAFSRKCRRWNYLTIVNLSDGDIHISVDKRFGLLVDPHNRLKNNKAVLPSISAEIIKVYGNAKITIDKI